MLVFVLFFASQLIVLSDNSTTVEKKKMVFKEVNLFCQMYIDVYQEHLTNLSLTLVHVYVSVISFL